MELEEAFRRLRRNLATARERAEGAQLMRCAHAFSGRRFVLICDRGPRRYLWTLVETLGMTMDEFFASADTSAAGRGDGKVSKLELRNAVRMTCTAQGVIL